jgi:hypothetical protein
MTKSIFVTNRLFLCLRSAPKALVAGLLCSLALASSATTVQAGLLSYEPFDYAPGTDIVGQNGGIGFTNAWGVFSGTIPAGSFVAEAGSLAGPAGLNTVGGHASISGSAGTIQPSRSFAEIVGSDGSTTWISFLGQRQGVAQTPPFTSGTNPYPRGVNVSFFDTQFAANPGPPSRPERIAVGNSSNATANEWSVIVEGSGGLRTGSGEPFENLAWAVLRIDHHGDHTVADDAYLWLNPNPLGGEPTIGSADVTVVAGVNTSARDYSGLDFVRPFVGNVASGGTIPFGELVVDELRIGTTWGSMNAVPEPASALLALVALLGAGCTRGRK